MAIWASVTVSIGEEHSGAFSDIFLVRAEVKSCNENIGIELLLYQSLAP